MYVEESVNRYVVAVLRHTRADPRLYLGASPRAGIALLRVAKARALAAGRVLRLARRREGGRGSRPRAPPDRRARGALGRPRAGRPRPRRDREDARPGMTARGRAGARARRRDLPRGLGVRFASARRRRGRAAARRARRVAGVRLTARPVELRRTTQAGAARRRRRAGSASSSSSSPRSRRRASRSSSGYAQARRAPRAAPARGQAPLGALRAAGRAARPLPRRARPLRSSRIRSGSSAASCRSARAPRSSSTRASSSSSGSSPRRARTRATAAGCSCSARRGFDLHSVRDYVEGDSLRKVHWRSTARRGRLMVKELEDSPRDDVAVVLDAWRGCAAPRLRRRRARGRLDPAGLRAARPPRGARRSAARAVEVQRVQAEGDWRRALELLAGAEADGVGPAGAAARRRAEPRCARARPRRRDAALDAPLVDRLVQRAEAAAERRARLRRRNARAASRRCCGSRPPASPSPSCARATTSRRVLGAPALEEAAHA